MPIVSTREGNLITLARDGNYRAICHGANSFCTMGSGIAPQIAKVWPEAEEVDKQTEAGDRGKLGNFTYHHDTELNLVVFNMYTQFGFGERPFSVNYEAVRDCFERLNTFIKAMDVCRVGLADIRPVGVPLIGAGLAGGHWEAIKTIIDLVTPDVILELVVYKP